MIIPSPAPLAFASLPALLVCGGVTSHVVRILFGHTSPETAFEVDDYPYGFHLRTTIRYWLETDVPKGKGKCKGIRFFSQTKNPRTGAWNKPKASVYQEITAALYVNEHNHVTWTCVNAYSNVESVRSFVEVFGHAVSRSAAVRLEVWARGKKEFARRMSDGRAWFTINGEISPESEEDRKRLAGEADAWEAIEVFLRAHRGMCREGHTDCLEDPRKAVLCTGTSGKRAAESAAE